MLSCALAKEVRHAAEFTNACHVHCDQCLGANESSAQVVRQEIAGVTNFAKIESTVACAGAITPAAIEELKKMGYASIIDLRLATEPGLISKGTPRSPRRSAFPTTTFRSASRRRIPPPLTHSSRRLRRPGCSPRSFIERAVEEPPGCGS